MQQQEEQRSLIEGFIDIHVYYHASAISLLFLCSVYIRQMQQQQQQQQGEMHQLCEAVKAVRHHMVTILTAHCSQVRATAACSGG